MARRGRFMSGGTGGSNMSQLIYNIMRQQLSRQTEGIVDAYVNQTDWRGGGVPSYEEVVAFLNQYASNSWVNQADKDTIAQTIAKVTDIEDTRVENSLVAAIDANPNDVSAVVEYVSFLREKIDTAASPNLVSEAKAKLFSALSTLATNIGKLYGAGNISSEEFDRQQQVVLNEFATTSSEYRQLLTTFVGAKYTEEYDQQNTALATASAQGVSAYSKQLKIFKAWLQSTITTMADKGLATVNEDGEVISGIDAAMDAQRRISEVDTKISKVGAAIVKQAATERYNNVLGKTAKFVKLVNQTLGSDYKNIAEFMSNQIDVQRFYSTASPAVINDPSYMGEGKLLEITFGDGNSLMSAAKASGNTDSYQALNDISKKYGRNTLVDDASILLTRWMNKTGGSGSDPIKNAAAADALISQYEDLLKRQGANIPASELEIHNRTLQALRDARAGKTVDFTDVSAFDLANPYSTRYDEATGGIMSTFQDALNIVTNSSVTANEVAAGGKIVSGSVGPNGEWTFGGAVAENDGSSLTYMDPATKRVIGVAPITIVKQVNGEPQIMGYVYNLGNGKFVVKAKTSGGKDTIYDIGYDPFSGTSGLTFKDFKNKYIQQVNAADSNGVLSSTRVSEFVIPEDSSTPTDDDPKAADPNDIALSGLKDRLASIPRSINNKDIVDRRTAVEVATAEGAAAGTTIAPLISALYTGTPAFSTGYIPGPASITDTLAGIEFRAGERASLSDNLSSYAFRNTPIADFFATPAGQNFRAGERADLGIRPLTSNIKQSTKTATVGKNQTQMVAK